MGAAVRVAMFPFRVVWRSFKLLCLPTAVIGLSWWLVALGLSVAWFPLGLGVLWAVVMLRLLRLEIQGALRSLGRGTVRVRGSRRMRRGEYW